MLYKLCGYQQKTDSLVDWGMPKLADIVFLSSRMENNGYEGCFSDAGLKRAGVVFRDLGTFSMNFSTIFVSKCDTL